MDEETRRANARAKIEAAADVWNAEMDPDGSNRAAYPEEWALDFSDPWTLSREGVTIDFWLIGIDSWAFVSVRGDVGVEPTFPMAVEEAWEDRSVEERGGEMALERERSARFLGGVL